MNNLSLAWKENAFHTITCELNLRWQKDIPLMNNATEQAIGQMKMRIRTV
jgi:hypothetical protein